MSHGYAIVALSWCGFLLLALGAIPMFLFFGIGFAVAGKLYPCVLFLGPGLVIVYQIWGSGPLMLGMCDPTFATPIGLFVKRKGKWERLGWSKVTAVRKLDFRGRVQLRSSKGTLLWEGFSNRPHLAALTELLEARLTNDDAAEQSS